ncbi:hypothetical protein EDB81DRAFT_643695, partial [Dactylonectria macrodidyma]
NHESSPAARAAILGMLADGQSLRKVAAKFNTSHLSIQYIKDHFNEHFTVPDMHSPGWPNRLTQLEIRYVIRLAKKDRDITWDALKSELGSAVSTLMLRRVIRQYWARK